MGWKFGSQFRGPACPQILKQLGPGVQTGPPNDPQQLRPQICIRIAITCTSCPYCSLGLALNLDHPAHRISKDDLMHVVILDHSEPPLVISTNDRTPLCEHMIWTFGTCWAKGQQDTGEFWAGFHYFAHHAEFEHDPTEVFWHIIDDSTYEDILPTYFDLDFGPRITTPRELAVDGWAVYTEDQKRFIETVKDLQLQYG